MTSIHEDDFRIWLRALLVEDPETAPLTDQIMTMVHTWRDREAADVVRKLPGGWNLGPNLFALDQWTEEDGTVLWWRFPIVEPPYCGSPLSLGQEVVLRLSVPAISAVAMVPLDGSPNAAKPLKVGLERTANLGSFMVGGWPGYHTHWTRIPVPDHPQGRVVGSCAACGKEVRMREGHQVGPGAQPLRCWPECQTPKESEKADG
jgi:hypothetical protein